MIFTDRIVTVRKGESKINEPIIVYRGDYELEVRFTIMNSKFKFMSATNLIESENAAYGQLAILTPYGGNIFSDIAKCNEGAVTFVLTEAMLNQIEEVGLYSFQIRLFDYNKESRISIPPVEFGIEVREPIASEDHDNSINNAIVGYSIAKIADALNEKVPDTFDGNGQYNKTDWETGDRITEGKLNKIEDALDKINQNEKNDVAALGKRVTSNFNVLDTNKADKSEVNSKIWGMVNMGQDVKEAMTGGSVAVVGKDTILTENIVDGQITPRKINNIETPYYANIITLNEITYGCYYDGSNGGIRQGVSATGLDCITPLYPVNPGEIYYTAGVANCVLFGTDKKYVGRCHINGVAVDKGSFTIPNDIAAAYMGMSLCSSDIDKGIACVRRNEVSTAVNTDYVVNLPELMPNDLLISDIWIFEDYGTKFNFIRDSGTITVEWNEGARLYFTYSYRSQGYVVIPSDEPLVLRHNQSWVYNIHTKEFRIIETASAENGTGAATAATAEWHHANKGDILLLKNANGFPKAGRLAEYFRTRYLGDMITTYAHFFWTGAHTTYTEAESGYRKLFISGGAIYAVYKNGGNKNKSFSGGVEFNIPTDKNTQLIWDTISNEVRVEPQGTAYNIKPHEILLLYFQYATPVSGEFFKYMSDERNENGSIDSSNVKHDMGRLKFKFDVDPGGSYISSESLVGDELWVFPVSNDEGTNFIKATRYKMDFENNTATEVGSFTHNWGHVNSSAYNPWRDALICGNGSGSYTLMGQIFIFENASSFKNRTQVDRSEAVTIDIQEWGYKANVVWGESNLGRGDICYVINNDAQNVRKLQLGMGTNNLGSGVMLGNRNDNQFNGTYQVLGQWILPRIDVVQGSNYENGALYIGLGHDTAWYTKNHLHDDGSVTYVTYKEKFYNANGTQLYCNMQGITVTDKYIILGLQGGNLPTNQIHVYHR